MKAQNAMKPIKLIGKPQWTSIEIANGVNDRKHSAISCEQSGPSSALQSMYIAPAIPYGEQDRKKSFYRIYSILMLRWDSHATIKDTEGIINGLLISNRQFPH